MTEKYDENLMRPKLVSRMRPYFRSMSEKSDEELDIEDLQTYVLALLEDHASREYIAESLQDFLGSQAELFSYWLENSILEIIEELETIQKNAYQDESTLPKLQSVAEPESALKTKRKREYNTARCERLFGNAITTANLDAERVKKRERRPPSPGLDTKDYFHQADHTFAHPAGDRSTRSLQVRRRDRYALDDVSSQGNYFDVEQILDRQQEDELAGMEDLPHDLHVILEKIQDEIVFRVTFESTQGLVVTVPRIPLGDPHEYTQFSSRGRGRGRGWGRGYPSRGYRGYRGFSRGARGISRGSRGRGQALHLPLSTRWVNPDLQPIKGEEEEEESSSSHAAQEEGKLGSSESLDEKGTESTLPESLSGASAQHAFPSSRGRGRGWYRGRGRSRGRGWRRGRGYYRGYRGYGRGRGQSFQGGMVNKSQFSWKAGHDDVSEHGSSDQNHPTVENQASDQKEIVNQDEVIVDV